MIKTGIKIYSIKGKIFITGDMNGHTSNSPDILDFDRYTETNDLFSGYVPYSSSNKQG